MKQLKAYIIPLVITAVLLSSCNLSNIHIGNLKIGEVRLGMAGKNLPGQISYSFRSFTGFESNTARIEKGQSLYLDYEVQLESGNLTILVEAADGNLIWERDFDESDQDQVEIPVEEPGSYAVYIKGNKARGSFELEWKVK